MENTFSLTEEDFLPQKSPIVVREVSDGFHVEAFSYTFPKNTPITRMKKELSAQYGSLEHKAATGTITEPEC